MRIALKLVYIANNIEAGSISLISMTSLYKAVNIAFNYQAEEYMTKWKY